MASQIAPYRLLRRGCRAGLLAATVPMAAVLHACASVDDDAPQVVPRQTAAPALSPSAGGSSGRAPFIRTLEPDLSVTPMRDRYIVGEGDARVLRYADSGDVSGDKTAVVGYMAAWLGNLAPANA